MENPLKILSDSIKQCNKTITFTMDEVDDIKIRFENMDTWYRTKIYEMQSQLTYCLGKLDKFDILESFEYKLELLELKVKELERSNSDNTMGTYELSPGLSPNMINIDARLRTVPDSNMMCQITEL